MLNEEDMEIDENSSTYKFLDVMGHDSGMLGCDKRLILHHITRMLSFSGHT